MLPILRLGPLSLQTPGLVLLLSFWLGAFLAEREAGRLGLKTATVNNGIFIALVAGILGARLVYAARYASTYLANPVGILSPNASALAVPEGLILGILAAWFYWWYREQPLRSTLDAVTPLLALLAVGIGVAHLADGTAFGVATRVPWAIYQWDEYRHPSQVYEICAALLILGAAWRVRQRTSSPGITFLAWVTLTAAARLFLERFRGDSVFVLGGLRAVQLAALAALLVGLWLMGRWARPVPPPSNDKPPVTTSEEV